MTFDQNLLAAANGWLKARPPFVARGRSKKYGVDCVNLAHALFAECGIDLPAVPDDYFVDESRHARSTKLVRWIEATGKFKEVPVGGDYKVGTLLCANIGLAPYHVAVVFKHGSAIHSVRRPGVCAVTVGDPVFKSVIKAYEVIL
jgi:cell wall-associated NlpC family hydrolase